MNGLIGKFIQQKQLIKDLSAKNLAETYLKKAKTNIITMELLSKATKFRDVLALPSDYGTDEWIVVTAYYAMYLAALSLLAKLGFRSKTHTATAVALEEFFVKKKLLDKIHLENFERIKMKKEEVEALREARDRREIAQYSVTKKTTKELADKTKDDAHEFVNRTEEILELL